MDLIESENLMLEYIKRFDRVIFLRYKYSGFGRFDIKNNRIVERSRKTLLINVLIIILTNIGVSILLSASATEDLKFPEVITVIHFVAFANLLMINSSFLNRRSGYQVISSCIEVDVFLGVEETCFMRDVMMWNLTAGCVFVSIISLVIVTYMYYVFSELSMKLHIIGAAYFGWLFCCYDDYYLFLSLYGFMSMRVKYLNVAIMKLSNVNTDYIPNVAFFDILLWKKHFDNKITFHTRAGQDFIHAFRIIFNLLDLITQSYRFAMILGVWTIVMGTFVSVQVFIIYIKSSDVDILRASVVAGWATGSWIYTFLFCQLTDMFYQQIEQTILICSYIQLKPSVSSEIHKLTKAILRTLEVREKRTSTYGLFYLDTGFVFRLASSTFVYITVQLQMAFPALDETQVTTNITISTSCEFIPPFSCPALIV